MKMKMALAPQHQHPQDAHLGPRCQARKHPTSRAEPSYILILFLAGSIGSDPEWLRTPSNLIVVEDSL